MLCIMHFLYEKKIFFYFFIDIAFALNQLVKMNGGLDISRNYI